MALKPFAQKQPSAAPAIDPTMMRYQVGTSVVDEFAAGHDFPAILRELVQNEYDAGGSTVDVEFREDELIVRGTGRVIDKKGWNRLSVMVGTGHVAGTDKSVQAKANGIGSKNFGLRALFLIGDTIQIRSGGKTSALNRHHGAYPEPQPDPWSATRPGVEIRVPYRTIAAPNLPAFDVDRERVALQGLSTGMAATLTKLAMPRGRRSLEKVRVRSVRNDRDLQWTQVARAEPCRLRGAQAIRRTIKLHDNTANETALTELEFVRQMPIPDKFMGKMVPTYFTRPKHRITIGVSFRIHRKKLKFDEPGRWFYPIGVDKEWTGNALNVSAPFDMDNDRSAILPTTNSDWNKWLIDEAVELAVDLLKNDWWARFGPDVFSALWPSGGPPSLFAEMLQQRLKTVAVWPGCAPKANVNLVLASDLVVPSEVSLDGFLSDDRYPPAPAARNERFRSILLAAGAKLFSINSLVRLRCGPKTATLATKLDATTASYAYPDYTARMSREELQSRFATALDAVGRRLSNDNRKDIKATASTLSASGELRPACELRRVPVEIASACPLPLRDRLHPVLLSSTVMRQSTNAFDANAWVIEVSQRAKASKATDEERRALYHYILGKRGKFASVTLAELRSAPVILDSRDEWIRPADVVLKRTSRVSTFDAALRFPHLDIESDAKLVKALRLRDKLSSTDLTNLARWTAKNPARAQDFERLLTMQHRLVVPTLGNELSAIPFLRSSAGDLQTPKELYVDNALNRACLGSSVAYYSGDLSATFVVRLGCRDVPAAADILARFQDLAARKAPLDKPEVVYPELLAALGREKTEPQTLAERQVAWTDAGWVNPADVFLDVMARVPSGSIPRPTSRAERLLAAFERLGAVRQPHARHWRALLIWAGTRFGSNKLTQPIRQAVRTAYVELGGDPGNLPNQIPLLLDTAGCLHSLETARAGVFLMNDDPELAEALVAVGDHTFADDSDKRTIKFYRAVAVRTLRAVKTFVRFTTDGEKPHPKALRPDQILHHLHSQMLAHAIAALVGHRIGHRHDTVAPSEADIARTLAGIKQLVFVNEISEQYRVGKTKVAIGVRVRRSKQQIYLAGVRGKSEVVAALAEIVARGLPHDEEYDWTDAVFRIMSAGRSAEIERYLASKGVHWDAPSGSDDENQDLESDEVADAVAAALGPLFTPTTSSALQAPTPAVTQPHGESRVQDRRVELPDLGNVDPVLRPSSGAKVLASSRDVGGGGGGWGPGGGQLRDDVRDRQIGRRGEEIVLRMERKRLRAAGLNEADAVWVANDSPTADHDIRSTDVDGQPLWIEVKASTGTDGKFKWSKGEFALAMRAREKYLLYRVYSADSLEPPVKCFRDPVALLVDERLSLDLAVLQAEIEPA